MRRPEVVLETELLDLLENRKKRPHLFPALWI
jgi:hypothetical protein